MAQEYQDLCSQNVEKVMRLIGKLDGDLRALLTHFKVPPPVAALADGSGDNPDIGQGDADEILKEFGM
jgi:chemotaxis regulatin CheY-phosphate phosphatase CheZ